jgi:hypothetical protein
MADDEADSTDEVGEVDREWTTASLKDPQNSGHQTLAGVIEEADGELAGDLEEADDIAARLRGGSQP